MAGSAQLLPPGTYPPQTFTLTERPMPGSVDTVSFNYDCTLHTDPAVAVVATLEYSTSNGPWLALVWRFQGAPGGAIPTPRGGTLNFREGSGSFERGPNRRIRGTLVIEGGPLALGPLGANAVWS
jgi:hypothetical protein